MGKHTMSRDAYTKVHASATKGGAASATHRAEERARKGEGMDPLVDPKGPAHLGPVRLSLPRFVKQGNLWLLTRGVPMPEETLLDTTGSMGTNVDLAFKVLPHSYEMYTSGSKPILGRYDPQIATAIFNDVEDNTDDGKPVLCRTQFEMDEKIAVQMTLLVPGRGGKGNLKEDPQFGLFGAAFLTSASINRYGLKYYHFAVSDEPLVEHIDYKWLKHIFGDDVLDRCRENGYDFDARHLPSTTDTVKGLRQRAHAFFLHVPGHDLESEVKRQWASLYGPAHVIRLVRGTEYLHFVKALVIGLTEGVLDLGNAQEFLREHGLAAGIAKELLSAVSHIPLAEQTLAENFNRLPKAGDLFREKTDLWPVDPKEAAVIAAAEDQVAGKPSVDWL